MRVSNQSAARRHVAIALLALVLTACAASVPSVAPSPTATPTPVITPDPHLTEPATADAIFDAIRSSGLPLSTTNAINGDPGSPSVKRINAAIDNWPLVITQYRNSATLRATTKWDPTKPPDKVGPAYAFVGLNILIDFGPPSGTVRTPDATRLAQAQRLVDVLDPLLWPLELRSLTPLATHTPAAGTPTATPSAASEASSKPSVTP
jgi:hypothetical protein